MLRILKNNNHGIGFAVAGMFCLVLLALSSQAVFADTSVVCKSVTYQESTDKNFFNITVRAGAPSGTTITGYHFDYGDHTTYDFAFDSNATADRTTATVRHTYQDAGIFLVKAEIVTTSNGKTAHTSGDACKVSVINSTDSADLTNTGPGNIVAIFFGTTVVAMLISYGTILRRQAND